jgi:hypothetical protein
MVRGSEKVLREYFFPSIISKMQLIQIMSIIDDKYKSFFAVSLQKRYSKLMTYNPKPLAKFEQYGVRPEFKLQDIFKE